MDFLNGTYGFVLLSIVLILLSFILIVFDILHKSVQYSQLTFRTLSCTI